MHQPVLDLVGVLEFVNEDIVETLAILFQHLWMIFEEPDHLHQQITKVERIGLLQALLVKSVDASDLLRLVITVIKLVRPDATIFGPVDGGSDRPRLESLIVDTEFLQQGFEQTFLILIIVDREIALETESLDLLAQNPHTGRMKGADPEALGITEELFETLPHLTRGLVGKGHCEDLPGVNRVLCYQPGDPMREGTGFTGAGPGQNKNGALEDFYRLPLPVIELSEDSMVWGARLQRLRL